MRITKNTAAGLSSSRWHETPLKAPRESKEVTTAPRYEARERPYFFIFFFFFGLLAMAYFLLNRMNDWQG
jgi:hypothetical protein